MDSESNDLSTLDAPEYLRGRGKTWPSDRVKSVNASFRKHLVHVTQITNETV